MKKLLLLLMLIAPCAQAQTPVLTAVFDLRTNPNIQISNPFNISNRSISSHIFTWSVQQGTLSVCTLLIQTSPDTITWTTQFTGNCTTNGTSGNVNFAANYIRVNATGWVPQVTPTRLTINWAGYTVPPSSIASFAPVNLANIANFRYAINFAGGDVCAQIEAAETDLPSTGGTIYAQFEGAQTCSSTVTITKPTEVLWGATTTTFSGSGTIIVTSCGTRIQGKANGSTTFKPASGYTGFHIVVQAGSCLNGFAYQYGVQLLDFKIQDGTQDFNGTGRTASADGILIRDTDDVFVRNIQVRSLKGTSLRLRNVRESKFQEFYSLLGGDSGKPAIWIGNTATETVTDDCNDLKFEHLHIGYPAAGGGLLIDTVNATSIATGGYARNITFTDIELEGQAVSNSTGLPVTPPLFDLAQLGHCDMIRFRDGSIGNWPINNNGGLTGLRVGSTSFVIPNVVLIDGVDFFGPSSDTYSACTPSACGIGLVIDHVNTFQMSAGKITSSDPHLPTVNITATPARVYIDPIVRIQQRSDPQDSNGAGITGTLTKLQGLYPPNGCHTVIPLDGTACTGQQTINSLSAIQTQAPIGDPTSSSSSLKVASNSNVSYLTTDAAGTNAMVVRTEAGAGGGTVIFDLDAVQIDKNLQFAATTAHINRGTSTDIAGTVAFAGGTTASFSFTTVFNSAPTVTFAPGFDPGAHRLWLSSLTTMGFTISSDAAQTGTIFWHAVGNPN